MTWEMHCLLLKEARPLYHNLWIPQPWLAGGAAWVLRGEQGQRWNVGPGSRTVPPFPAQARACASAARGVRQLACTLRCDAEVKGCGEGGAGAFWPGGRGRRRGARYSAARDPAACQGFSRGRLRRNRKQVGVAKLRCGGCCFRVSVTAVCGGVSTAVLGVPTWFGARQPACPPTTTTVSASSDLVDRRPVVPLAAFVVAANRNTKTSPSTRKSSPPWW